MKSMKLIISIMFFIGLCLLELQAQQGIPTSGGNASGTGGSATYTIGQVIYTTNTATSGSVSHGVQQAFEIFIVTGLEEAKAISLQYSAYPNPTKDYLILKIEGELPLESTASLFDMNGKLLENKKIESNEANIDMTKLLPAIYFLKIIRGNKEIKTFKIIKN